MKKKDEKKEKINLLYFNKNDTKTINKKRLTGMIILLVVVIAIIVIYMVIMLVPTFIIFQKKNIKNI